MCFMSHIWKHKTKLVSHYGLFRYKIYLRGFETSLIFSLSLSPRWRYSTSKHAHIKLCIYKCKYCIYKCHYTMNVISWFNYKKIPRLPCHIHNFNYAKLNECQHLELEQSFIQSYVVVICQGDTTSYLTLHRYLLFSPTSPYCQKPSIPQSTVWSDIQWWMAQMTRRINTHN